MSIFDINPEDNVTPEYLYEKGFVEDLADVLCSLNDNDMYRTFYGFAADPKTGREFDVSVDQKFEYDSLKNRKIQSLKTIYKNKKKKGN